MIMVLMGVSGSGKSTLGKKLAEKLHCPFIEGDDYHSPENKAKMAGGTPLDDSDRLPWLRALAVEIKSWEARKNDAVVACSSLKKKYRDLLSQGVPVRWIYLRGTRDLIRGRLEGRGGHFMGPALLESQFADLEEPVGAIVIDIDGKSDKLIEKILDQLKKT